MNNQELITIEQAIMMQKKSQGVTQKVIIFLTIIASLSVIAVITGFSINSWVLWAVCAFFIPTFLIALVIDVIDDFMKEQAKRGKSSMDIIS